MSVDGFHWEGFFRAMQGEIFWAVTVIIFTILALFGVRLFLNGSRFLEESEKIRMRKVATISACVGISLVLIMLSLRMVTVATTNRIPRSDADKSGVYQQMDSASEHAE